MENTRSTNTQLRGFTCCIDYGCDCGATWVRTYMVEDTIIGLSKNDDGSDRLAKAAVMTRMVDPSEGSIDNDHICSCGQLATVKNLASEMPGYTHFKITLYKKEPIV